MTEANPFIPARNQDAHPVLRGFVYQVELTILRWLQLRDGETLELERGEDIDRVARAVQIGTPDDLRRTLEQVKHREKAITLRSGAALESLANFVLHRSANPNLQLHFCYTTNARIGRERPNPFVDGLAGISLWMELASDESSAGRKQTVAASLLSYFRLANKPRGFDSASWKTFLQFVGSISEANFIEFANQFEWNCGTLDVEPLERRIIEELGRFGATDSEQAKHFYQRLFLFVFKLLTQGGIKRLNHGQLDDVVSDPNLSPTDHELLNRLINRFGLLERRMDQAEASITGLHQRVHELSKQQGFSELRIGLKGVVSVETPPLVEHLCERHETVAKLVDCLNQHTWVAIYGSAETGKSHLAGLMAKSSGTCRAWIRFHHAMSLSEASALFHQALSEISGRAPRVGSAWYHEVCVRIGSQSLLVLDDLPNLPGDEVFTQRLRDFAEVCRNVGLRIVSTSQYQLPLRISTGLSSCLLETPIPRFSDSEAREVLLAHQAPDVLLTSQFVGFINGLAQGHPLLLALSAQFLRERDWQFGNNELEVLLRGNHTILADEVIQRVCRTLDDAHRELLYRLTLAVGNVADSVAIQLAAVVPPIDRVRERLTRLIGAWVQRDVDHKLVISPLAKNLGSENLPAETRRECHLVLAKNILEGTISLWDAQFAMSHFLQADKVDSAGILFLEMLDELRRYDGELRDVEFFASLWATTALPTNMSFQLRFLIRISQASLLPKFDRPMGVILSDLDRFVGEATVADAWAVANLGVMATVLWYDHDLNRNLKYLSKGVELSRHATIETCELAIPDGRKLVELLWHLISGIRSFADLRQWVNTLEEFSPDERNDVMRSSDAALGCVVLSDRLMLIEANKPNDARNWSIALEALDWLQERADALQWEYLTACVLKTEVNLHGEYLKDIEACSEKVRSFVSDPNRSDEAKALVAGMFGRQFTGAGRHPEARPWLDRAISTPTVGLSQQNMMNLLAATKSYHPIDRAAAVRFAERAGQLALSDESLPELEAFRALAEWGIAIFLHGEGREQAIAAFPVWNRAAEKLFHAERRDNEWKEMVVIFSHIQGFFTTLSATGQAIKEFASGDEYAAPQQGIFFTLNSARLEYLHPETIPGVKWLLSKYASACMNEDAAEFWLEEAIRELDELQTVGVADTIRMDLIPTLLQKDRFDGAIDAAIRGTRTGMALRRLFERGENRLAVSDAEVRQLILELPQTQQQDAERFAVTAALIPATFRVLAIAKADYQTAIEQLLRLSALCRQVAHLAIDPRYWSGAAEVFDTLATTGCSFADVIRVAHRYRDCGCTEVQLIAYVGASIVLTPGDALFSQLAVMNWISSQFPPNSETYRKVILPSVESFWTESFRSSRFHFHSPSLVEEQLLRAIQHEPSKRLRAILRAVHLGLTIRGIPDGVAWLQDDTLD